MIPRCRCCGLIIPADSPRATFRRCTVCDICDRRHGDERETVVTYLVSTGQITMWHGVATMAIDDAHLAGHLTFVGDPRAATFWIPKPVPRWCVVVGRALAIEAQVPIDAVIGAVINRYVPGPASQIGALKLELADALSVVDSAIELIDVRTDRDVIDPAHLLIGIRMRAGVDAMTFGDEEIPSDIATRPRGQA